MIRNISKKTIRQLKTVQKRSVRKPALIKIVWERIWQNRNRQKYFKITPFKNINLMLYRCNERKTTSYSFGGNCLGALFIQEALSSTI